MLQSDWLYLEHGYLAGVVYKTPTTRSVIKIILKWLACPGSEIYLSRGSQRRVEMRRLPYYCTWYLVLLLCVCLVS
jgi:hypothetical protein